MKGRPTNVWQPALIVAAGLLILAALAWGLISATNHMRRNAPVAQPRAGGRTSVPEHQLPRPVVSRPPQPTAATAAPGLRHEPTAGESKRIDPPLESPATQIADLLRQSKYIYLGCNVDQETCEFLASALATDLAPLQVKVGYGNIRLVEGIFTPPPVDGLLGINQVNLAVIQEQGPNGPQLYLDASNISYSASPAYRPYHGYLQLPDWIQTENDGGEVGPIEADKAEAAKELAETFARYWLSMALEKP